MIPVHVLFTRKGRWAHINMQVALLKVYFYGTVLLTGNFVDDEIIIIIFTVEWTSRGG